MTTYLISYDLSTPGRNYDDLIEHIKAYGTWSHPLQSVWLVSTTLSAEQVRDAAAKFLDSNDKILVVVASRDGAWRGIAEKVSDWLKTHL